MLGKMFPGKFIGVRYFFCRNRIFMIKRIMIQIVISLFASGDALSLTKGEISNGGSNCGTNTETNADAT
jgi:hypothetical protein